MEKMAPSNNLEFVRITFSVIWFWLIMKIYHGFKIECAVLCDVLALKIELRIAQLANANGIGFVNEKTLIGMDAYQKHSNHSLNVEGKCGKLSQSFNCLSFWVFLKAFEWFCSEHFFSNDVSRILAGFGSFSDVQIKFTFTIEIPRKFKRRKKCGTNKFSSFNLYCQ